MITLKTRQQLDQIILNGKILREAADKAASATYPGMTTLDLDKIIEDHILSCDATPTFKGYGGHRSRTAFPRASCISVNSVLVHGIPGPLKIGDGDIISIDIGVSKNGMIADSCFSYGVGSVSEDNLRLLKAARDITMYGIEIAKPGIRIHDLAAKVAEYAESLGYITMPDLYGHGLGTLLHEKPTIPFTRKNLFREPIPNPRLEEGMVITIEPVIALLSCNHKYTEDSDNWALRTSDGSWSAQFEHDIAITSTGSEILTQPFPSKLIFGI